MKKQLIYFGYICFFALLVFLTFNKHSKSKNLDYHSEIWADKAGYYVYLPAAFKYSFNTTSFPDSIDKKTGNGFILDYSNNKVLTKYTYGVSLMQLPFFCIADFLAKPLGFKSNGFSKIYRWGIDFAAVFYVFFGLIFLKKYLRFRFNAKISFLVPIILFFGTNLYYYSIDETGMSHVYSFFLFSYFLYFIQKTKFLSKQSLWKYLMFGFLVGLIVLIRPTNILFLSCFIFLDIKYFPELVLRLKQVLEFKKLILIGLGVAFVFFPQFIYWDYSYNTLIHYSYENESFHWFSPKLLHLWFSPNNGLFLYTPFYFILLISLIYTIKNKILNGYFILFLFLILSYVLSSWWSWSFGCSFGSRSYVEYLALFSIPFAYLFRYIIKLNFKKTILIYLIILFFILFNLKLTYTYDYCFYGTNWDWNAFVNLIISPTK